MFNFLGKKTSIGIDISDHSVKALKLSRRRKVVAFGKIELQDGVVEKGIIRDKKKLALTIKKLLMNTEPKPLFKEGKNIKVNLNIPEIRTFIHVFKLPKDTSSEEVEDAVLEKVTNKMPIKEDDLYWGFIEIEKKKQIRVLYYAAFKEAVKSYIEVMKLVGLEPVVLDVESISVGRAMLPEKRNNFSSMIINIGGKNAVISVFDKHNVPKMSVDCAVTGSEITKVISAKLGIDIEAAEKLKREKGMDKDIANNEILPIVEEIMQRLVGEAKKTIDYYEDNYNSKIDVIFLAGGSARLLKIDEYLINQLKRRIFIGDPLKNVKNRKILEDKKDPISFANTIGIALRGRENPLSGINFIDQVDVEKEENKKRGKSSYYRGSKKIIMKIKESKLFVGLFLLIALGVFGFVLYGYVYKPMINPSFKNNSEDQPEIIVENYEENEKSLDQETEADKSKEEEVMENVEDSEIIDGDDTSSENDSKQIADDKYVVIRDTSTGWLNVREGPGLEYSIIEKIYPGDRYLFLGDDSEWYEISLDDEVKGWVSEEYANKE